MVMVMDGDIGDGDDIDRGALGREDDTETEVAKVTLGREDDI